MATLSANQQIQSTTRPPARCKRGQQEQGTLSADRFIADGFLKHAFLPLFQPSPQLPEQVATESQLFQSLYLLEAALPAAVMNVSDKAYPHNILLAHWDAQRQLEQSGKDTELFIIQEGNQVKFAVRETVYTGRTLYYIPLMPLHRLIASGKDKHSAELLLSVFAYLYHVAHVPHYRDEESFLYYHYQILEDDLANDWNELDELDMAINRSALHSAKYVGDTMQRRIHNPCHLAMMKKRISGTTPRNTLQQDCLMVAREAFELWQKFPDAHLFSNITTEDISGSREDDDYDDERDYVALNEYVHFVAETEGALYDSLSEMVNCEFAERAYTQEPALFTRYEDTLTTPKESLDYERRLFGLFNDLCQILNNLS